MSIEWFISNNEIDAHLSHKAEGISAHTIIELESALQIAFAESQALVHVLSGRLRASGRTESDVHNDVWTGEVVYGNAIVDYAPYEFARGEDHDDFMDILRHDSNIGVAFRKGLED